MQKTTEATREGRDTPRGLSARAIHADLPSDHPAERPLVVGDVFEFRGREYLHVDGVQKAEEQPFNSPLPPAQHFARLLDDEDVEVARLVRPTDGVRAKDPEHQGGISLVDSFEDALDVAGSQHGYAIE